MHAEDVRYSMEIQLIDRPVFYMGHERESRIHERMCKFMVNGTRVGYGISEWCYRSVMLDHRALCTLQTTPGPVSTWMGDHLWLGKPSRYVTATEVNSAFYPPWDGKMMSAFGPR